MTWWRAPTPHSVRTRRCHSTQAQLLTLWRGFTHTGKAIVRVNVFRSHRQTVQYVQPQHAERVSQAELLIIDEAAAIPLPMVKALLGPYLVFL